MIWREATRVDVPAVVALLADEVLGHGQDEAGDAASAHGTYGRQLH